MLTSQEIAAALNTTRTEFSKIFWEAQSLMDIPFESRIEFEAVAREEADDSKAFETALDHAENKKFLFYIITMVVNAGLEKGALAEFLLQAISKQDALLHAITNPPAGFIDPLIFSKRIVKYSQMTGKVLVNGATKGTGILVGPNLFLTAWHVIQDLFDNVVNVQGQIICTEKIPLPLLQVEFNSILDLVDATIQIKGTTTVAVHTNWLVTYSTCHHLELKDMLPDKLSELDPYNDYAILRLAKAVGLERGWALPDKRSKLPEGNANIVLLQHPNGVPLKMDYSKVVDLAPPDPAIPKMRFLHGLNALGGASGGPCFDKEFSLVGLHQGSWPNKINGNVTNRAIPIGKIIDHYSVNFPVLPQPDPADCPVWCLDKKNFLPFIGYDDFQSAIWKSLITGNKRLITIAGGDKSGKSFLADLVYSLLNDAQHLKILLQGENIAAKTALELCTDICAAASVPVPDFVALADYNSTPFAWLKDELVFKLFKALDDKRANRTVWLCIKNLNKISLDGAYASDFLFLIYEKVIQLGWFRVLLDGMRADISSTLIDLTQRYRSREITQVEIKNCLNRAFADYNVITDGDTVEWITRFLLSKYQKDLLNKPTDALMNLCSDTQEIIFNKVGA